jgi:hypothetical protein
MVDEPGAQIALNRGEGLLGIQEDDMAIATQWNCASVAPQRDGYYELRANFIDKPDHEPTTMWAEWRDGRWWLDASSGPYNGQLTPDFTWREMSVSRAC